MSQLEENRCRVAFFLSPEPTMLLCGRGAAKRDFAGRISLPHCLGLPWPRYYRQLDCKHLSYSLPRSTSHQYCLGIYICHSVSETLVWQLTCFTHKESIQIYRTFNFRVIVTASWNVFGSSSTWIPALNLGSVSFVRAKGLDFPQQCDAVK